MKVEPLLSSRQKKWIQLSFFFTFFTIALGIFVWLLSGFLQERRMRDDTYLIKQIVITSDQGTEVMNQEILSHLQLQENLYAWEPPSNLSDLPFVLTFSIQKMRPNTIALDYQPRRPIARVGSHLLDAEGKMIPALYYSDTEKLPLITSPPDITTLKHHLKLLKNLHPHHIDYTKASHPSLGRREIVVTLLAEENREGEILQQIRYLRLCPDNFDKKIANYEKMEQAHISRCFEGEEQLVYELRLDSTDIVRRVTYD